MKEVSKTANVPVTGADAIRPRRRFFPGVTARTNVSCFDQCSWAYRRDQVITETVGYSLSPACYVRDGSPGE
jgi:hypothetical protein